MALVLACLAALSSAYSRVSAVAGLRELPGATIVTGGLVALVTGLSQAPAWGWTATTTLALLATGVALLVGFVAVESRAEHPLVPMGLLRVRTVAAGNAIMVLTGAALLGLFYFLSLYEQVILHYGAITAGLSQLPFALALIAGRRRRRPAHRQARFQDGPQRRAGPARRRAGLVRPEP